MIPSQNRIEISVKGATSVLVGVKGLISSVKPVAVHQIYPPFFYTLCLQHTASQNRLAAILSVELSRYVLATHLPTHSTAPPTTHTHIRSHP